MNREKSTNFVPNKTREGLCPRHTHMSVTTNIQQLKATLPTQVGLIAVSKFQPVEKLQEAYEAGQRLFGENRALEMRDKHSLLPQDIQWHFIGHLQRNKIKYIAPFVAMIHSVDSPELLEDIDRAAEKAGRTIPCLLQLHIAREETKFGFSPQEALDYLAGGTWRSLEHIRLCGMMGMATFTDNQAQVLEEFGLLKQCFDTAKEKWFAADDGFRHLSMGMSDDYPLAIQCGSTMVRIGTAIFGSRPLNP